jgi:hypothetical protein
MLRVLRPPLAAYLLCNPFAYDSLSYIGPAMRAKRSHKIAGARSLARVALVTASITQTGS